MKSSKTKNKTINGAYALLMTLESLHIKDTFGYPGGAIIPLYNQIYDYENINVYEFSHEQGCVFAASGYAKTKNDVGVCFVTSGPGATNIVTGLYDAYMDSVPIIAITGNVNTSSLGLDAFQECDILSITKPITKYQKQPKTIEELVDNVVEAYYVSKSGRPRPVLIDFCKDVQLNEVEYEYVLDLINKAKQKYNQLEKQVKEIDYSNEFNELQKIVSKSNKVVAIIGNGIKISGVEKQINEFCDQNNILIASTLHGLDIKNNLNNNIAMVGMHGSYRSNLAIKESDLIIGIGIRFDDRVTGNKEDFINKNIVHIDIDKNEQNRNIEASLFINANLKDFVPYLLKLNFNDQSNFNDYIKKADKYYIDSKDEYNEFNIIKTISEKIKDCYVTTDVGQHQMFSAQAIDFTNHKIITSGGSGTMGYGIPSAIGSSIASKNHTLCVVGDGGFMMSGNELSTILGYNIPVQLLLIDNSYLGMVRQWQDMFNNNRISGTYTKSRNPNFEMMAKSYNINTIVINNLEDLNKIEVDTNVSNVIIANVETTSNVLPIIPANKSFEDIIVVK